MNNIKPQWVFVGFVAVGALWLAETSNRPVAAPDYSVRSDKLDSRERRVASIPYEQVALPPADPLSPQVAEKKVVQPLTARMLVANRGEFFAVQSTALPAQEQALMVDMGRQASSLKAKKRVQEQCQLKDCTGQGASDY